MDIFDRIQRLFGFDIREFFFSYANFVDFELPKLILFYKKGMDLEVKGILSKLNSLQISYQEILNNFELQKSTLNSSEYFSLLDEVEDIGLKLQSYSKLQKWLGGVSKVNQSQGLDYILSKNENLEQASSKIGYNNSDEGSLELSLKNRIKESDYDLEGGFLFRYNFQDSRVGSDLTSVVDYPMQGESLLGKDLSSRLEFLENDLKTLTPDETFTQACETALGLKVGDNPEIENLGIDKTLLINRVTVATAFPIIFRQLMATIALDDTIKKVDLKDVFYEQDSLRVQVYMYSQLNTYKELTI